MPKQRVTNVPGELRDVDLDKIIRTKNTFNATSPTILDDYLGMKAPAFIKKYGMDVFRAYTEDFSPTGGEGWGPGHHKKNEEWVGKGDITGKIVTR